MIRPIILLPLLLLSLNAYSQGNNVAHKQQNTPITNKANIAKATVADIISVIPHQFHVN